MIKRYSELNTQLLYHGRHQETPYGGNGIYLTPDKEYAKRYAGDQDIYVFKLNVPEDKIFSFSRKTDVEKIKPYFPKGHWQALLGNVNDGEMDWAGAGDLANSEFEETDDFLKHLGYAGMYLTERTGIKSIYLFDEKDATLIRREK